MELIVYEDLGFDVGVGMAGGCEYVDGLGCGEWVPLIGWYG